MSPEQSSQHEAPASEAIIRLQGVTRRFGQFTAVDDVTLDIHRGEVFGLIGHNGAGKSTLFRMMLGLLGISSGQIDIAGSRVGGSNARAVRQKIGYLPENVALWDNLSGLETLKFFARLKGLDTSGCTELLARVGLAHAGERPVRAYSKGMRQRLGFAQALQGNPQVLFLDEPTTGLDPRAIHFFWNTLAGLREQGLTIVLTSHILAELQHRVDRVAVMTNGRVTAMGSLPELRERFELPLTLSVRLKELADSGQIEQFCRSLPASMLARPWQWVAQNHTLLLRVGRQDKMRLLARLIESPLPIADIQTEEPSLEDMFFSNAGSPAESSPPLPHPPGRLDPRTTR